MFGIGSSSLAPWALKWSLHMLVTGRRGTDYSGAADMWGIRSRFGPLPARTPILPRSAPRVPLAEWFSTLNGRPRNVAGARALLWAKGRVGLVAGTVAALRRRLRNLHLPQTRPQ